MKRLIAAFFACLLYTALLTGIRPVLAGPAAPATAPVDPASDRLTFLMLQLSSAEESIKALNAGMKAAGYKAKVAADKADSYEKGNNLMDRKGGAPVPWDEFYGKTAAGFYYHSSGDLHASEFRGVNTVDAHYNGSRLTRIDRPRQFDYIYRANIEQAAKAKAETEALGRQIDQMLARRRKIEAEQSALWATISLESIQNLDIGFKPLYHWQLAAPAQKPGAPAAIDTARTGTLRALVLFLRTADQVAAKSAETVGDDQERTFNSLKETVQSAQATAQESAFRASQSADLDAADQTLIKDALAITKRMAAICKNTAESYRLALEGDAAEDEQRKLTFRAQLQESLLAFSSATAELDGAISKMATDWGIHGQAGVDNPDKVVLISSAAPPSAGPTGGTVTIAPPAAASGPQRLFNGASLEGWTSEPQYWSVENGAIRGKSDDKAADAYAISGAAYRNFVLDLDFKLVSGNSGVFFRADSIASHGLHGFEADIFVPNAIGKLALDGAVLYRPDAALQKRAYIAGDWNHYRIEAVGEHIRLWINNQLMTDTTQRGPEQGRIALQVQGRTEILFREITIQPLPDTPERSPAGGAAIVIKSPDRLRVAELKAGEARLYDSNPPRKIEGVASDLQGYHFTSIPQRLDMSYEVRVTKPGIVYVFGFKAKTHPRPEDVFGADANKWQPADSAITGKNIAAVFRREVAAGDVITIKAFEAQIAAESIEVVPGS
jgi:hypothetical protein